MNVEEFGNKSDVLRSKNFCTELKLGCDFDDAAEAVSHARPNIVSMYRLCSSDSGRTAQTF
jgi:hypothetical protein